MSVPRPHRTPSSWWDLWEDVRSSHLLSKQRQEREAELVAAINKVALEHHQLVRETRRHTAWVYYIRDDIRVGDNDGSVSTFATRSTLQRNAWNEQSRISTTLPYENGLDRYAEFASFLRDNPQYVSLASQLVGNTRVTFDSMKRGSSNEEQHMALIETICFSLYGDVFHQREFNRQRAAIREILRRDLMGKQGVWDLWRTKVYLPRQFQSRLTGLKIFEICARRYGALYLSKHFHTFLMTVLLHTDPLTLSKEDILKEKRAQLGIDPSASIDSLDDATQANWRRAASDKQIDETIQHRTNALFEMTDAFLANVLVPIHTWPFRILLMISDVLFNAKAWKDYASKRARLVTKLLVGVYVIPCLDDGNHSGVFTDFPVNALPEGYSNLVTVLSLVEKVMYGELYRASHPFSVFNDTIRRRSEEVSRYCDSLASYCEALPTCQPTNDLHTGSVCVSMSELVRFASVLFAEENIHLLRSKPEHKKLVSFEDLPVSGLSYDQLNKHFMIPAETSSTDEGSLKVMDLASSLQPLIQDALEGQSNSLRLEMRHDVWSGSQSALLSDPNSDTSDSSSGDEDGDGRPVRKESKLTSAVQAASQVHKRLMNLLLQVFCFLNPSSLVGYTGSKDDLSGIINFAKTRLRSHPQLHLDWDHTATLLTLMDVIHELPSDDEKMSSRTLSMPSENSRSFRRPPLLKSKSLVNLHGRDKKLKRLFKMVWAAIKNNFATMFENRIYRLEEALEHARHYKLVAQAETRFLSDIIFKQTVILFTRNLAVPCVMKLKTFMQRTSTRRSFSTSTRVKTHKRARTRADDLLSGPIFECNSLLTFIHEYKQFGSVIVPNPSYGASLIHYFLDETLKRLEREKKFSNAQVELAVEISEHMITTFLFSLLYDGPMQLPNSTWRAEDVEFEARLQALSWVKPRHLECPHAPEAKCYWQLAVDELNNIADHVSYRTPYDKTRCLTACIKLVVKVLLIHAPNSDTASATDAVLSSVIYVIILAKCTSLPSCLRYIQTFRHPDRLDTGEDAFCLTTFLTAIHYITHELELKPEPRRASMITRSPTAKPAPHDAPPRAMSLVQTNLTTPKPPPPDYGPPPAEPPPGQTDPPHRESNITSRAPNKSLYDRTRLVTLSEYVPRHRRSSASTSKPSTSTSVEELPDVGTRQRSTTWASTVAPQSRRQTVYDVIHEDEEEKAEEDEGTTLLGAMVKVSDDAQSADDDDADSLHTGGDTDADTSFSNPVLDLEDDEDDGGLDLDMLVGEAEPLSELLSVAQQLLLAPEVLFYTDLHRLSRYPSGSDKHTHYLKAIHNRYLKPGAEMEICSVDPEIKARFSEAFLSLLGGNPEPTPVAKHQEIGTWSSLCEHFFTLDHHFCKVFLLMHPGIGSTSEFLNLYAAELKAPVCLESYLNYKSRVEAANAVGVQTERQTEQRITPLLPLTPDEEKDVDNFESDSDEDDQEPEVSASGLDRNLSIAEDERRLILQNSHESSATATHNTETKRKDMMQSLTNLKLHTASVLQLKCIPELTSRRNEHSRAETMHAILKPSQQKQLLAYKLKLLQLLSVWMQTFEEDFFNTSVAEALLQETIRLPDPSWSLEGCEGVFEELTHAFAHVNLKLTEIINSACFAEGGIQSVADRLYEGLEVSDRTFRFHLFRKTFLGSDAVKFLLKHQIADSEEKAVALGNQLLANHIVVAVTDETSFVNKPVPYRFMADVEDTPANLDLGKRGMAKRVAEQLTLMQFRMFCSIKSRDLTFIRWMKDSTKNTTTLYSYSQVFNKTVHWVVNQLADTNQLRDSTKLLQFFIKVATRCAKLGNFDTVFAIFCALLKTKALQQAWHKMDKHSRKDWIQIEQLCSSKHSYAAYHNHILNEFVLKGRPSVPFIATILNKLAKADARYKLRLRNVPEDAEAEDAEQDLIDWGKLKHAYDIIQDEVVMRQKVLYNIRLDEPVWVTLSREIQETEVKPDRRIQKLFKYLDRKGSKKSRR